MPMGKVSMKVWILCCAVLVTTVLALRVLPNEKKDRIRPAPVRGKLTRRLPNALLIGVKKGGTRALIEMLALHPQVKASGQEVHFFDRDMNYQEGLSWYRARMRPSLPGDIIIEKSPAYFVTEAVPERILSNLRKNIKLILVLRNPVSRVVSDFMQGQSHITKKQIKVAELTAKQIRKMQDRLRQKVLLKNGSVNAQAAFISTGLYDGHLARWLKYFRREQLFITSTDDLVHRPNVVLKDLARFLHLRSFPWDEHLVRQPRSKFVCLNRTASVSTRKPGVSCLNGTKGRDHIPIPPELQRTLYDFFRTHNSRLFDMIGKRFDSWDQTEEKHRASRIAYRLVNRPGMVEIEVPAGLDVKTKRTEGDKLLGVDPAAESQQEAWWS